MHVIGTAGHVDHGKSTLVERLTGIDPDRFAEEKRRGLTIDLGFAWLTLPSGQEVGIVDVPGHERFIRNMLAGAGGVTACLFVVAANEGWMPQSAEHLAILDVLGVSHGVVALTKADAVDTDVLDLATAEVEERLAGSSFAAAPVIACSATTGRGIDELVAALDRMLARAPAPTDTGRPRLWVDRVFTIAGAGTVVTGTLAGGSLATGDEVEIAPEGRRARIRTIQSHKKEVERIAPGNRVALNLAGLERQGAERGDAIVTPGAWSPTNLIDVELRVLRHHRTDDELELTPRGAHLLYVGSAEIPVRVRLLDRERLVSDEIGIAQLELRDPLPIGPGDRFVIRDAGRVATVAGGRVLDPLPPGRRDKRTERAELLHRLREASPEDGLVALVEHEGAIDAGTAEVRTGVIHPPATIVRLGHLLASETHVKLLSEKARAALERHHAAHPLERGMAREALRSTIGLESDPFDALIETAADLIEEGPLIRLATHAVRLAPDQESARARVIDAIEGGGFTPPLAKELPADAALLRALTEAGELVKIGDFYLTAAQAADARARIRAEIERSGPITVAAIRTLLNTSRKYAVPLCEWLDATGATRRQGDVRVLGPER